MYPEDPEASDRRYEVSKSKPFKAAVFCGYRMAN